MGVFRVVASRGVSGSRPPIWNLCPPFHVWISSCCTHPILYLKNVALLCGFWPPPAAKSWRQDWVCWSWNTNAWIVKNAVLSWKNSGMKSTQKWNPFKARATKNCRKFDLIFPDLIESSLCPYREAHHWYWMKSTLLGAFFELKIFLPTMTCDP